VDNTVFRIVFSILVVIIGIRLIVKKEKPEEDLQNKRQEQRKSYYWIIMWGFITGVTASFIGIGGGLIAVPVLTLFFLEEMHFAVATSLFIMIFTAAASTGAHLYYGNLTEGVLIIGIIIAIGAVVGSQIGSYIQPHLKGTTLQVLFGCFMIGIAIPLLWLRPLL